MTEEAAIGESQTAEAVAAENVLAAGSTIDIGPEAPFAPAEALNPKPLVSLEEVKTLLADPEPEAVVATVVDAAYKETETVPCGLTFEQYLRKELVETGQCDYRLCARQTEAGDVIFYVHPFNKNGISRDFEVLGEIVRNITKLAL